MNEFEAYKAFGLSPFADKAEIDRIYQLAVQRWRSRRLRGTLSEAEEKEVQGIMEAYRFILHEELLKRAADYRERRYGRYRRFAGVAERIDHYLYYYRSHAIVAMLVATLVGMYAYLFTGFVGAETVEAANAAPDLSVVMQIHSDGTEADDVAAPPGTYGQDPELGSIAYTLIRVPKRSPNEPRPLTEDYRLFKENADLYLLDLQGFRRLLAAGYLKKLEQWDTYGIDLSASTLGKQWSNASAPWIAAVSANAAHPEQAIRFIQRYRREPEAPSYK